MRITLDAAFKRDLDRLRALLSHRLPSGDVAAVLREAVRCGIEKHGKRRGAVAPFDHVVPVVRGGPTTAGNLRLVCRAHNVHAAELWLGREHMAQFRSRAPRQGEFALASGGTG